MTTALRSHNFSALQPGVRLIVLGAVHGNETCGTRAIERVLAELDGGALRIARGSVTFVPITNPLAYQLGQRAGERNLNRNLRPTPDPQDYEDRIANALCPLLRQHEVLLDLHSFHTAGQPFAMIGPRNNDGPLEPFKHAGQEEAWALRLGPRRLVEGWLDTYATGVKNRQQRMQGAMADARYGVGTTEYMRSQGGFAITLECGQHVDPQAPEVGYRAIRNTLAHFRLLDEPDPAPRTDIQLLQLNEVVDRLDEGDRFARPWASYDPLRQGELIGTRADGTPIKSTADGFIVFPNPGAATGGEWFYIATDSPRVLAA
jgi:predicted deacylase